jgi:septum formation protein
LHFGAGVAYCRGMHMTSLRFILGSRSPRRLELLEQIVPPDAIEVLPPHAVEEAGFEGLEAWPAIEERLLEIARHKSADVERQVRKWPEDRLPVVITADTMIVAAAPTGRLVVLGQPPADATWPETVRHWFRTYYAGRTHTAATGFRIVGPGGQIVERVVKSLVSFTPDVDRWLEWYLATGEPRGKAGGYALQGAGSLFIERVEGSLSNVIGLPIREVFEAFQELGIDVGRRPIQ